MAHEVQDFWEERLGIEPRPWRPRLVSAALRARLDRHFRPAAKYVDGFLLGAHDSAG